jgi:hypothetical protein
MAQGASIIHMYLVATDAVGLDAGGSNYLGHNMEEKWTLTKPTLKP